MKHLIRTLGLSILVLLAMCAVPGIALATPSATSPAAGAYVPYGSQAFSWTDNLAQGPLDHWYLEISTSPSVDYYYFGFFNEGLVYTSGDIRTSSVNLNALGKALAPGTYYWHVVGFYGAYGGLGTAWTTVRSFTVQGSTVVAPAIAVSPASFYFSAVQGTPGWLENYQLLRISNKGGGTLRFNAYAPGTSWFPVFGSWSSDGQIVTVQVSCWPVGLAPGIYRANITVADNGSVPAVTNSPVLVPVTLQIFATEAAPPTGCSISINAGAPAANRRQVTLNLSATDAGSGMGEMRFDNNDDAWSGWYDYARTQTWLLTPGNGTKTVRAQFRDKAGNTASTVSDSIVLNTGLVLVYRFYNVKTGTHFYTASEAEKANVIANLSATYKYEGVSYLINTLNAANAVPLHRFYNIRTGVHFYTASGAEKANVIANLSSTYKYEGVAYKVSTTPTNSFPVYRFFNFKKGVHFYTASETEKASVIANLGSTYKYEGIGYYIGR